MAPEHDNLLASPSLARTRLLNGILPAARLALVVAPAGSGKTTLLSQYATAAEHPVAWLRAEAEQGYAGHDMAHLMTKAVTAATGRPCRGEPNFAGLLDLVEGVTEHSDLSVVVDDAHTLGEAAEATVERLLVSRPPRLRLLVASRQMPRIQIPRVELGTVALMTSNDLRFRSWEVEALFRDVYREPLPPADSALLARRTEGWAASLQLFHLATAGRSLGERRRAVATLTRQARFVRGYLTRAVLDDLPPDLRFFLRRTSVFEVLTAARCDQLLDSVTASTHLDELERRQALTTSDDGGHSYRYHELLRRHLEGALQDELGSVAAPAWHWRAGSILEHEGAFAEAVRAYARADAWSDVRRLLATSGERVAEEPTAALTDVLPPRVVEEDPWLSLSVARRQGREGRVAEAVASYRRCVQLFERRRDRERVSHECRLVGLWDTGEPRPQLHWLDRLRLATSRHPPTGTAADDTSGGDAALGAAVTALLSGRADVGDLLDDLLADSRPERLPVLAARLVAQVAAAVDGGDIHPGAERLAADAERHAAPCVARLARALTSVSPKAAEPLAARRVVGECDACGDAWGAALASAVDGFRLLLEGAAAHGVWSDTAARMERLDAGVLASWAHAFVAVAAVLEGHDDAEAAVRGAGRRPAATMTEGSRAVVRLAEAAEQSSSTAAALGAAKLGDPGPGWLRPLAETLAAHWDDPATGDDLLQRPRSVLPVLTPETCALCDPECTPPTVTLRCFGGFSLRINDQLVDGTAMRPRVASLLRMLAMHAGEAVHREVLVAALWPDSNPTSAFHSLHVAMSSLRASLAGVAGGVDHDLVARAGETYRLALPADSDADVLVFRTGLQAAQRARAAGNTQQERAALGVVVQAYAGDLLPDDGPAEWVASEREELRLRAGEASGRLADLELVAGDPASAVTAARRACQVDPWRDASWRTLIAACERCGDDAEGERARAEYTAMLASLGVAESPATLTDVAPQPSTR